VNDADALHLAEIFPDARGAERLVIGPAHHVDTHQGPVVGDFLCSQIAAEMPEVVEVEDLILEIADRQVGSLKKLDEILNIRIHVLRKGLELQQITGFGRTPVHHAVNRLSADTLIIIRPRHGLHIAPIDLARERMLLALRRDMERFVVRLAADRASLSHRNQALHIERLLRERRATLTLDEFNSIDRRIDALVLEAAGEPFLVHTLRPLHTLYRRIGYIHHRFMPGQAELSGTIDRHLAILVAVAGRHVEDAVKASDALIDYMDHMFTGMEAGIDPRLLDCSIEPLLGA